MDNKQARYLHRMLDRLAEGKTLKTQEIQSLRKSLPEPPKQKTLEEILEEVKIAARDVTFNYWSPSINMHDWLRELHAQLKGLKDVTVGTPALPAGMRLADHPNFGRVIVSPKSQNGDYMIFAAASVDKTGADWFFATDGQLTFLDADSDAKSTHPKFLETEADYENAPEGTIVSGSGQIPWAKEGAGYWACSVGAVGDCSMTQSKPRRVLRWGWGNE